MAMLHFGNAHARTHPFARLGWALWLSLWLLAVVTPVADGAAACTTLTSEHQRFGFNFSRDGGQTLTAYDPAPLHAGWYLDYTYTDQPVRAADLEFIQIVRSATWRSPTFTATLTSAVTANPGVLWLAGNEPDRRGQDNLIPTEYAAFYHQVYQLIKGLDPTAQVAIGGVVQPTPLRLRYLDMVLAEYARRYGTALPVDVWNVHAFILPENYIWGAAIPPGLDAYADEGMQYGANDHDNMTIFMQNIRAMRQWMAARGQRDKPLIVSEYGILLSPRHGFDYTRVRTFMLATFDFFRTATDANSGYPADGNRLVQRWSWFSLNAEPWNPQTGNGFNGNLYNPTTFQREPLGQDFIDYVAPLVTPTVDLMVADLRLDPPTQLISATAPVRATVTVRNAGSVTARDVVVQLWQGDPASGGSLIAESTAFFTVAPGCNQTIPTAFEWQPTGWLPGNYTLFAQVRSQQNTPPDSNPTDNQQTALFLYLERPLTVNLYLPQIER